MKAKRKNQLNKERKMMKPMKKNNESNKEK